MKYIISVSYGNDSIALIQLARDLKLNDCVVVYCNTGWESKNWHKRVKDGEDLAKKYNFKSYHLHGDFTFESMVKMKKGFPSNRYQFCSGILKGLPFLEFCEKHDPLCKSLVLIGKRREESRARKDTPEFVLDSKYHGGRVIWHPLYKHTEKERNVLINKTCLDVLPHRSMECSPCVNANRSDLLLVGKNKIDRIRELEETINNNMFRPKNKMNATGIDEVIQWAHAGRGKFKKNYDFKPCVEGMCGL